MSTWSWISPSQTPAVRKWWLMWEVNAYFYILWETGSHHSCWKHPGWKVEELSGSNLWLEIQTKFSHEARALDPPAEWICCWVGDISCYQPRKTGEKMHKSVQGCIVDGKLSVLNLVIVTKFSICIERQRYSWTDR